MILKLYHSSLSLMNHPPSDPYPSNIPIIPIPHPFSHAILPVLPTKNVHIVILTLSIRINVSHDNLLDIPQHSLVKPAQMPFHAHHFRSTHCTQPQSLCDSQIIPAVSAIDKSH